MGLKPMVRKESRGGGLRKRGWWSWEEVGRLRFRGLVGWDWARWEDRGWRRLMLD